MMKDNRDRNT